MSMSDEIIELSDEQLMLDAKTGHDTACEKLLEKYQGDIYNFAYTILGNTEDAEDTARETFIKAFKTLQKRKKSLNFSTYLYKTARDLGLNELKRKRREEYHAAQSLSLASEAEGDTNVNFSLQRTVLVEEQQTRLRRSAASLPAKLRIVLALKELKNLPYERISSITGLSKKAVGTLLLRARLKFNRELKKSPLNTGNLSKYCQKKLPLLSAYTDDELPYEQREKVGIHLENCQPCQSVLGELIEASKSFRSLTPLVPPAILKEDILSAGSLSEEKPTRIPLAALLSPNAITAKIPRVSLAKQALVALTSVVIIIGGVLGGLYGLNALDRREASKPDNQSKDKVSSKDGKETPKKNRNAALNGRGFTYDASEWSELEESEAEALSEDNQEEPPEEQPEISGRVEESQKQPGLTKLAEKIGLSSLTKPADEKQPSSLEEPLEQEEPSSPEEPVIQEPPQPEKQAEQKPVYTAPSQPPNTSRQTSTPQPPNTPKQANTPKQPVAAIPDSTPPPLPALISPQNGARVDKAILEWSNVSDPSGVTYTIEIQRRKRGNWQLLETKEGLTSTRYFHEMEDSRERWRIWAVDGAGHESPKTDWSYLRESH